MCVCTLWHADPLLRCDREIGDCTATVVRQRPTNNNRGIVFFALFAKQQLNSNRGTVFPVLPVPKCYKQDISFLPSPQLYSSG
jgi:hypothetical protein